jgi:hypothetical protein
VPEITLRRPPAGSRFLAHVQTEVEAKLTTATPPVGGPADP